MTLQVRYVLVRGIAELKCKEVPILKVIITSREGVAVLDCSGSARD
jgi:hypothetical protein